MTSKDKTLNFEIIRSSRIRAICHNAVDTDQEWNSHSVKLRTTKEFLDAFNETALAILLRAMDSACRHGRTTVRPEDVPTLCDMGLDDPKGLGVGVGDPSAAVG